SKENAGLSSATKKANPDKSRVTHPPSKKHKVSLSTSPPQKTLPFKKALPTQSSEETAANGSFQQLLQGTVFVLSGFQNPFRSELRDKALEMGAKYRPDWTPDSTHLICAFANTPKYSQVKGLGGTIVRKEWILDCHRTRRCLPCKRLGTPVLWFEAWRPLGAVVDPLPKLIPCLLWLRVEEEHRKKQQGGRRLVPEPDNDPYAGSTDENTDVEEQGEPDQPIPELPDLFVGKCFFLYGEFPSQERRLLNRYIIAFNGELEDYMNERVNYVITAQEWDDTFDEALNENPNLSFVRPRWIYNCNDRQKLIPHQPYVVVPRA
uniref:X-ray repair cross complementing 1 n=1 Tax=Pseudonaja textilis TaxID=8673 RepID=A0A670ZLM9_PSETE